MVIHIRFQVYVWREPIYVIIVTQWI